MSDKAIEAAAKGIHFAKDCHREWIDGGRNCDCWEAATVGLQAYLDASEPLYRAGLTLGNGEPVESNIVEALGDGSLVRVVKP